MLLSAGFGVGISHAETPSLAANIMAGIAALPDRSASFTQDKHLASLAAPVRSSGRLTFNHPAHMEQITVSPRPERFVIDGGTVAITGPDGATRQMPTQGHPALQGLATTLTATLAGNLPLLQTLYDVQATGTPQQWRIALHPRDPTIAHVIRAVNLAGANADLRRLDITMANGDTQQMAITPTP